MQHIVLYCKFNSRLCTDVLGWVTVCRQVNHIGMQPVS